MSSKTAALYAEELVGEYFPIVNGGEQYEFVLSKAKKCAIMDVENTIKALQKLMDETGNMYLTFDRDYYREVKEEIRKL